MHISKENIKIKQLAGKTDDGKNILYIETIGGLHALFTTNSDGQLESIAASPHKAITIWMANKKNKKIDWNKEFLDNHNNSLEKSELMLFDKLRQTIFSEKMPINSTTSDLFLVYDWKVGKIDIVTKSTMIDAYHNSEYFGHEIVRSADLKTPPQLLKFYYIESYGKD